MDRNKAMKLWTAIVTAFLALCTTLGLVTTTAAAAAAVPQTDSTRTSSERQTTTQEPAPWSWSWSLAHARSLPPTMKQRIRAEAHGKTPSCRHRESSDTESTDEATACEEAAPTP